MSVAPPTYSQSPFWSPARQAAMQALAGYGLPADWLWEINKWPDFYVNAYLQFIQQGDHAAASGVVTEARQSPYLYSSDGQWIYPNRPDWAQLSPAEQESLRIRADSPQARQIMGSGNIAPGDNQDTHTFEDLPPSMQPPGTQPPGTQPPPGDGAGGGQQPQEPTPPTNYTDNPWTLNQDQYAFSNPVDAVGAQLRGAGWNTSGNPLAQRAEQQATLAPYQHQLQNGWNSDPSGMNQWLTGWIDQRNTPGQRAMTFTQGSEAFNNALYGGEGWQNIFSPSDATPDDQLRNVGTYMAGAIADNVNPIAQRAYQSMLENQHKSWTDSVLSGGDGGFKGSFTDWLQQEGWKL